jgi:hypothetical protein
MAAINVEISAEIKPFGQVGRVAGNYDRLTFLDADRPSAQLNPVPASAYSTAEPSDGTI